MRAKLLLVVMKVAAIFTVLLVIVGLKGNLVMLMGGCTPRRVVIGGRIAPRERATASAPTTNVAGRAATTVMSTMDIVANKGNGIIGVRGLW